MNSMIKITILILLVGLSGCDKTIGPGVVNDTGIRVLYVDKEGVNIIQKSNPEFNVDDIKLYYYNDKMEYVQRYDSRLDVPDFVDIIDSTYVGIGPIFGEDDGTYVEGGVSTTYLDFGNSDIDTIQVSGLISSSVTRIYDVWYNGVQVQWKNNCGELIPCGFKVVK